MTPEEIDLLAAALLYTAAGASLAVLLAWLAEWLEKVCPLDRRK